MKQKEDLRNMRNMWSVIDIETGEILFQHKDQERCINVALVIRRLEKWKRSLCVL